MKTHIDMDVSDSLNIEFDIPDLKTNEDIETDHFEQAYEKYKAEVIQDIKDFYKNDVKDTGSDALRQTVTQVKEDYVMPDEIKKTVFSDFAMRNLEYRQEDELVKSAVVSEISKVQSSEKRVSSARRAYSDNMSIEKVKEPIALQPHEFAPNVFSYKEFEKMSKGK